MKIVWEKAALADLRNQLVYCRKHFGKRIAEECKSEMISRANILAIFPYAGVREPLLDGEPEGFRALVIHPNVKIIYCVNESQDVIQIYRLWDTRMSPTKLTRRFR
ncbi:MAG: type II toxin-antitoxin system RelE/ParE family toxin [Bacteroidaceae bacterium]|nr:type II toxin-antitoxin system RelE/ParE family toxin [Bacteroidaceae bacterium]